MSASANEVAIERAAPLPTWLGVGGCADRLARPGSVEELRRCVDLDPGLRVLGDGANLLVDDEGVGELVVVLGGEFGQTQWTVDPPPRRRGSGITGQESGGGARIRVGAAVNLPKLILECVRRGLGGIEGLGGIPATVGGAVVMNAGGKFGQIADAVACVQAVDRQGGVHTIEREEIDFAYRRSGLNDLIITVVELALAPSDSGALRERLREVMAYKKDSQPLKDRSAGCCFKNPVLSRDVDGIGRRGDRVGAGLLIDRAGCKGLTIGGASVSPEHANFIVAATGGGARARDVIRVMEAVEKRVLERFGVRLEREVVVWSRT